MPGPIHNFSKSDAINTRFHQLVPAGSHTYSKGEDQFPRYSPKLMARADGAYCWDVDDNRYIDWAMGNRVFVLGHNHPAVCGAVKQQIDCGLNFTRPGYLEYQLAEYLVDLLPVAEMVKFGKNGSDVTTAAMRLARAYTGRKYIAICKEHPFFSVHDWFIGSTPMHAGVPDEIASLSVGFSYNDLNSLAELYQKYPGQIAAVILEPVKNDAPKEGFLEGLRAMTLREGSVLIFDEMISGIRFDIRGAHHLWKVYPDLATFGKAYANGFSFSLLAGRKEIMELGGLHHDRPRVFLLSQTHSSETIGLAACLATLQECQKIDVTSHIWHLGGRLAKAVRELAKSEGVADYVRVIGFDCNPQILCTHPAGAVWPALQMVFHQELISWGVLIPWISVTSAHREKELSETLDAIQKGMQRVKQALDDPPVDKWFSGEPAKPVFRPYNQCLQSYCGRIYPQHPQLACCRSGECQ